MRLRPEPRDTLYAWAALVAATLAWFGSQQLGSNVAFAACPSSGGLFPFVLFLVCLLLIGTGLFFSWRIWKAGPASAVRPFLALVGMVSAGILGVAIVLDFAAGLIIPGCFA